MTQPRISGFLNNCPMHVGVPELLLGFRYFAKKENPDAKISVNPDLDACKTSYEQLKKCFEEFYQLEKLSWKRFHELVTTEVNNNSTAAQAMLGPALRFYMSKNGFEKNKCIQQADGKFATLFSTDIKNLFEKFGINVRAHEINPDPLFTGTAHRYLIDPLRMISHDAYKIDIYNEGSNAHWERCPKNEMSGAIDGHATLEQDAKTIRDAMVMQSLSALKGAVKVLFLGSAKVEMPNASVVKTTKIKTDEDFIQNYVEDVATRYTESLKVRKIPEKFSDIKAKKENVRQLVRDLFNLEYDVKPVVIKPGDTEINKQIAEDEALARKLQGEEVKAARGMKL